MKHLLSTLTLVTLIAQPAVADEAVTLDLAKVNQRIEAVIQESAEPNDVVTGLFLRLDEQKTKLDAQDLRVKGELGGTIMKTPWDATQPSTVSFGLDGKATNPGSEASTAAVQISAAAKTDVLKLVNYLAKTLISQGGEPSAEESAQELRARELLAQLSQATDLDQVYAATLELRDLLATQPEYETVNLDVLASLRAGRVETIVIRADLGDLSFFSMQEIVFEARLSSTQAKAGLKFRFPYPADVVETIEGAKTALIAFADGAQNEVYEELKSLIASAKAFLKQLAEGSSEL